jgi:imidazolonepropionase-like amidohydrolase
MGPEVPEHEIEARGVTVLEEADPIETLISAKKAAGLDAVKIIIEDGPPPWYPRPRLSDEQVSEIVRSAHRHDLKVFAHISSPDHVKIAADAGADGILHAPFAPLPEETLTQMAEQGMWFVPTFSLYDGLLTWSRAQSETDPYALKGVYPGAVESLKHEGFLGGAHESEAAASSYLEAALSNLQRALKAGAPVALGSDVNNPFVFPGYSAHEELDYMVKAGMTPVEALSAATLGGARFLGAEGQIGCLASGCEADIILLARNPLEDIRNTRTIVSVFSDGTIVSDPVGIE